MAHKQIDRILFEEVRHIACKIHGSDIGIRFDLHITTGLYLRHSLLTVILLADIGLRRIVIIHHRDRSRTGCIFRYALGLGPAVYQVGKTQIGGKENILQSLQHPVRCAAIFPNILIGDLHIRRDGHRFRCLHIAGNISHCFIFLLGIRYSGGDRILLLLARAIACSLGPHRRGGHIAGARNGFRSHRKTLGAYRITAYHTPTLIGHKTSHLAIHRSRGIIFTEKERRRCGEAQFIPWFGRTGGFSLCSIILGCSTKGLLDLRPNLAGLVLPPVHQFFIVTVPGQYLSRHRIRSVEIIVLVDGILCLHRYIALRIDGPIHLDCGMGVCDTNSPGDRERSAPIGYSGGQLTSRGGCNARISFTGNHGSLSHLGRHITMRLRPADIDRKALHHIIERIELHHLEGNLIGPGRINRNILLCIEVAIIHIHLRIHMTNAYIEAKACKACSERLNRRTSIRKNADVPRLVASAHGIDICLCDIHLRRRCDFGSRSKGANIGHLIRKEILHDPQDASIVCNRRNVLLYIGLAGLAHLTGGGGAGGNFNILSGDGISTRPSILILPHTNLRMDSIADVPGIELCIGGSVDGHVAGTPGIDGAIVHSYARDTHGRAKRCHFNIPVLTITSLGRKIRRLDDEHATFICTIRLRVIVSRTILYRNADPAAIRKNLTTIQCEILLRLHGDLAIVRLYLSAGHGDISSGGEHDAVSGLCRLRSPLNVVHIYQIISIGIGCGIGR